ncbi:MAG: universal stress protein [Hyphomicrobiaceae bacterium]|nr:universal stress protein [Hyphomicrobiaceae bacterium]
MTVRTIAVHLNRLTRAADVLASAISLARRFKAHLIGLCAFPGVPNHMPLTMPATAHMLAEVMQEQDKEIAGIETLFSTLTAGEPITAEMVSVRARHSDLAAAVLEHARAADLVVAGQRDLAWDLGPVLEFPERLAIEAGRPVLLIPRDMKRGVGPFSAVMVAWNGSREAARAAFDAVALLDGSAQIRIVAIDPDKPGAAKGAPASVLAAALARHGFKADVRTLEVGERSVPATLREEALLMGADLVVMGAYGHSRLRELVFGGVTRSMAADMPAPILFSH